MKYIFVLCFCCLGFNLSAQSESPNVIPDDTLVLKKSLLFGSSLYLKGIRQTPEHLVKISFHYPQANKTMRKARNNYYASIITGVLGFALINGSLNGNAPGEVANWPVTGAGTIVLSSSFLFYRLNINQLKKGMYYYNKGM